MGKRSILNPQFYHWVNEEQVNGRYVLCFVENGEKWYHATSLLSALGVPNKDKVWAYGTLKSRKLSRRVYVSDEDEFTFVQVKHLCSLRWVRKIANEHNLSLANNKVTIKHK